MRNWVMPLLGTICLQSGKPVALSKSATRNIPTLTEVVRPTRAKNAISLDTERVVEQVMQRLTPKLEGLIHATLQPMVQDQLKALTQLWSLELEATVRQTVDTVVEEQKAALANKRSAS
jgi:hypothetical protein